MAKESMKAREVKRAKLAQRYAHKREEIAAKVKAGEMDHEEAWIALSKLPRNSNPIRQHNRCMITGRPKGYMRQFGISRIQFREMASNGLIPGVKKASWESLYIITLAATAKADGLESYFKGVLPIYII